jgi:hypothetical protein
MADIIYSSLFGKEISLVVTADSKNISYGVKISFSK